MTIENDLKLDKVIVKVEGLLKLVKDTDDEESQTAFLLAQKLIMKYNIDRKAIRTDFEEEIVDVTLEFGKRLNRDSQTIAGFVGANFRVVAYNTTIDGIRHDKLKGFKSDVELAKIIYQSAVNLTEYHTAKYADNLRREIYRENMEDWMSIGDKRYVADARRSYKRGFISGMSDKLADQRENLTGDYALVVKLPKQVQEFNDSLTFTNLRRWKEVLSDEYKEIIGLMGYIAEKHLRWEL